MNPPNIIQIHDVKVVPSEEDSGDELSKTFYRSCSFCTKMVRISSFNFKSCLNIGGKRFFCPFCLRNNFHFRSSRHVLGLSYRSIIGHYYHKHYLKNIGGKKLWITQIQECIDHHERVGLHSPVYSYDPETYMWFIDFNRVGKDKNKAPLGEVLGTAHRILWCFSLSKMYGEWCFKDMWKKYEEAIKLFYSQRKRPKNRRMLIPTLKNLSANKESNDYREFVPSMLDLS